MHTPFFPALRSRLAALGRHTAGTLRQTTLPQFRQHLSAFLPPPLLSAQDEGLNSRDRCFSLRLTFECFIWQMLQPRTSCREVVRQVQALLRLAGRGPIDDGDSAYVQARKRLPVQRLKQALNATASAAAKRLPAPTTLQGRTVKVVDGSTVQLVQKELLAYLIAHNLIRCLMAQAVARHAVELDRVSFKGSVDALRQFSAAIAQARNRKVRKQLWEDLLLNLARDLVPKRTGRQEPRAVKRRPKPYPLLNQPRRRFVEISHRNRYWKGRPRNYRILN